MPAKDNEVRVVLVEAARVQVAALNAAISFWDGWLEAAREFANAANQEMKRLEKTDLDTDAAVGRMTDASRAYLRRMTQLPEAAAKRFNADLENAPGPKGERTRPARAKE
jgi:hypothetical protein